MRISTFSLFLGLLFFASTRYTHAFHSNTRDISNLTSTITDQAENYTRHEGHGGGHGGRGGGHGGRDEGGDGGDDDGSALPSSPVSGRHCRDAGAMRASMGLIGLGVTFWVFEEMAMQACSRQR